MFFLQEGFTYRNFLMDMVAVFAFVVWFWLLVVIYGDLFRRHDISGWAKALWVLALVLTSYLSILAYLIAQGRGMAERNTQQAQQAQGRTTRRIVGFSVTQMKLQARSAKEVGIDNRRRIRTSSQQAGLVGGAILVKRLAPRQGAGFTMPHTIDLCLLRHYQYRHASVR